MRVFSHNCFMKARVLFPMFLFLLVSVVFVPIPADAVIYYVSEDGNDSWSGTENEPWRTVQKAAETLVTGDTVYIKEGTYHERVIPQNSGSPGNYITYAAYPGDSAVIDGDSYPDVWGYGVFDIHEKRYIKISGLTITNSGYFGIWITGNTDHIIIENNYIYDCQSSAINAWYRDGIYTITNIIIDGNEITETNMNLDQEGISLGGVDTFEIKNNHIHHVYMPGIDMKEGSSNGKIYKNRIHNLYTWNLNVGIYVDAAEESGYNIDIFQNIVYEVGDAIALATENGGSLENIKAYNNICFNNIKGFAINSYTEYFEGSHLKKNITVINNTFCDNNIGIFITEYGEYFQNFTIRNNIISGDDWYLLNIRYLIEENFNIDHNLFSGNSEVYGDDYIVVQPRFVNPSEADFHLLEGSPAIDRGSAVDAPGEDFDGNVRPQGRGYDIGAYEFQNYTNPFNPRTRVKYDLSGSSYVTLIIYDLLGREIQTLVNENQGPGSYQVVWDGEVAGEYREANGIYFYLLKADNEIIETGKLILIK